MSVVSVTLSREEFVQTLGRREHYDMRFQGVVTPPRRHVSIIWDEAQVDQPRVVVVPASELRDFYAFVSTYVSTYFPFSAFFRVIPSELAEVLSFPGAEPEPDLRDAVTGVVLGEAFLQVGARRLDDIPLQACLATQSAVGAAVISRAYDPHVVFAALDRWQTVREHLNLESARVSPRMVLAAWQHILLGMTDSAVSARDADIDERVVRLVRSAHHGKGTAHLPDLRDVAGFIPADVLQMEDLSREDRVRAFDKAMSLCESLPPLKRDVVRGYLAAQVAGGSFNYINMALQPGTSLAPLWFGLFASFHPETDVVTNAGCLGRHIQKKLSGSATLFAPLEADLAFEECLLLADETRLGRVRSEQQSALRVELLPGVVGRFRLEREPRRDATPAPVRSAAIASARDALVRALGALADLDGQGEGGLFPESELPKVGSKRSAPRKSRPKVR